MMLPGYDSWLDSLIPEDVPDPEVVEVAVASEYGAFNWQVFTKRYDQENVPDWAWESCQKGPFITPYAKFIFLIHLACAKIKLFFAGDSSPIHPLALAGHTACRLIDEDYLQAALEIERTWSQKFLFWSTKAEEGKDSSITIYEREGEYYSSDLY